MPRRQVRIPKLEKTWDGLLPGFLYFIPKFISSASSRLSWRRFDLGRERRKDEQKIIL